MFSILHISDLHRSIEEPTDNASLLAALLLDRDRYAGETPSVPAPKAIVVSGDLIQGARVGLADWPQSMKSQYKVANDFLVALCDRFLDGDKSQMVLVPGNHDVCWNTSRSSMGRVPPEDYPKDIYRALIEPGSSYRWSWSELALYRIVDLALYERRMDHYWDFVEGFYNGVALSMPIDRTRGYQLFELCNQRVVVAAFNSIARNDCFNYSGAISRGVVGQFALDLRDAERSYDLKMAVWHHSIQGPPIQADYMDASQVQEMIGHGFQIGLHGHQHVAAAQTQLVHLDESSSMAVVSAGSLCAGARELPRGVNRQYNLVVIEDDFLRARIHVREMGEGEQFSRKRNGAFIDGFTEISWQPPTDIMGRKINAQADNARHAIGQAEAALHNGRPLDAVEALRDLDLSSLHYARKLMMNALLELSDWSGLAALLRTPNDIGETVTLINALVEVGDLTGAQKSLDTAQEIDRGTRVGIQGKIDLTKMMRQQ